MAGPLLARKAMFVSCPIGISIVKSLNFLRFSAVAEAVFLASLFTRTELVSISAISHAESFSTVIKSE